MGDGRGSCGAVLRSASLHLWDRLRLPAVCGVRHPGAAARSRWAFGSTETRHPSWSSAIAPGLALILLVCVGIRFGRFNSECYGLDRLLMQIPRGARLLYLPVDRLSANSPFPVFLHSGMWHQVRQGGVTDFSFARFHMNRFRYCEGAAPTLPDGFEWRPAIFDWDRDGEEFDYFLVRSRERHVEESCSKPPWTV